MPPKMKKNVLVMVTNVGSTSLEQNSLEEEPFIDKAKYAMRKLVEKKIFMQPKDEIGIITMGDETDNPENCDYIKLYRNNLLIPNWEMIKYINNLSTTSYPCNWIEALHVAICFIKQEVIDPEFRVFLIIFNNFKEDENSINQYSVDVIANDLRNCENLHLLFVGENQEDSLTSVSEKFVLSIMEETGSQYEQINNFIEARMFYIPPPISPMSWNVNLKWGDLMIPCATYVKVTDAIKLGPWKMQTLYDDVLEEDKSSKPTNIVKENIQLDTDRNEIKQEEILNGYKFGGKYVPFSKEDENAMIYTGSTKGLMIYGFVRQNEVKLEYWSGSGSRIIVPATNDDAVAFYSLVQAMVDQQYAAIVRKVYANNKLPSIGILFPKMDDDDIWCLVHLELPYSDDIRIIQKRPIKSLDKIVNKEKLDALDDFIDSMTISGNELVYLSPGMFPNVHNQYHWNALADRALNPNKPLLPLNNYIQKYLTPPEELKIKAKPHLEKLNNLFDSCENDSIKNKKQVSIISVIHNIEQKTKDVNETNQNIVKEKNSPDEGLFSPDDIDLGMDEIEEM